MTMQSKARDKQLSKTAVGGNKQKKYPLRKKITESELKTRRFVFRWKFIAPFPPLHAVYVLYFFLPPTPVEFLCKTDTVFMVLTLFYRSVD